MSAKTGERYTTARRHVVSQLATNASATIGGRAEHPAAPPQTAPPASVKDLPKTAVAPTRGSVTDEKARQKTGHGLDHWFAVLDRFGGVEKGHSASASHLYDDHGVPGWYAQGITVAYERARGAPHGRAGSLH